ncbi:MAG: aldehyde dehydrogenase family protein, partial [Caulobacteraceae bacterium]
MRDCTRFYIDGRWTAPAGAKTLDVINPATEAVAGRVSLGRAEDVDAAVAAAR